MIFIPVHFCTGCLLNDLNVGHYQRYYDSGVSHLKAENYYEAKRSFAAAIFYAQTGHLGPEASAAACYNYAIAVGHLGDFQPAEDSFKRAVAFDEKAEGKDGAHAGMRLFELARLYQAWGRYSAAIDGYEKAIPLAAKYGAEKSDPIGYATVLGDYLALLKEAGFEQRAESVEVEIKELKDANPGAEPKLEIRYYPTKGGPG